MSDGTWEANHLRRGWEPWPGDMLGEFDPSRRRELMWQIDAAHLHEPHAFPSPIHWSPCDEGCRHAGPLRVDDGRVVVEDAQYARRSWPDNPVEASWRAVDVRTLGWAHDLRISKLSALCLRCWAERSK